MKKLLTASSLSLSLLLAACNSSGTASVINDLDGAASSPAQSSPAATAEGRVIDIAMKTGAFEPATYRLAVGENVVLRLTSVDGKKSLISESLGLTIDVDQGQTKAFNVPTDTAGTFLFHGAGDQASVTGQFIIE